MSEDLSEEKNNEPKGYKAFLKHVPTKEKLEIRVIFGRTSNENKWKKNKKNFRL